MSVPPEVVAVLGTIGGGVIVGLFGVWVARIQAKAASQRHFRELVLKAATDNWKARLDLVGIETLMPLEHFIIHAARVCDVALDCEKLTPEQVCQRLDEIGTLVEAMSEHALRKRAEKRGANTLRRQPSGGKR